MVVTSNKSSSGRSSQLKQRIKSSKKRSHSSQLWLERQLNDPYVQRAKREGYRSRAAFKLIEIDEKYHILKYGMKVVDLGAAPGGWAQVASKKVGSLDPKGGKVIGIDLLPIDPLPGVEFEVLDFLADYAPKRLKEMLDGKADLVMSDMAANTTGHKKTDHLRIMGLVEEAAYFATEILAEKGSFLAKVFQGGTEGALLAYLKQNFSLVRHVKPAASRTDSSELYVLASGFHGKSAQEEDASA